MDRAYRELSGQLIEAVRTGDAAPFLENQLPFEECTAVLISGQSIFPDRAASILKTLARSHFDDGVRYNAIALLEDAGQLTRADIENLLQCEHDPETHELLSSL